MLDRLQLWTLARRGPISRLALWVCLSTVAALALQTGLVVLGVGALSPKTTRTVFGLILFAGALVVMGRSERPIHAFGLAIGERWAAQAGLGLALGGGLLILQTLLALTLGGWSLNTIGAGRALETLGKAIAGVPIAIPAVIVYAGFVAGALRERLGPTLAALGAGAMTFGFHALLADPAAPGDTTLAAVSLGLAVVIAAQARFITGDIATGAGLLAGMLVVERFVRKAPLLAGDGSALLAPERVLLPAPALIGALALVVVVLAGRSRAISATGAPRARLSPAFLRAYPFATMGALAPIDLWLRELTRARWRVDPVHLPRLIATLVLSLINSILTLPERLGLPILTRRRRIEAPIFILGVHRSGTTHLHNLMSLDPAFCAPTTWQVMNPHGFHLSGWLLRPIFALCAPWRRPQDAVAFGLSAPAEEEFAIANTVGVSPDWSYRLPREHQRYDRFCYPDRMSAAGRARFGTAHRRFLQSMTIASRKTPLLKSPHNTGRLAFFADLYPGARFVHIRRDPESVYRSNITIEETAHALFRLQTPTPGATYADRFPALYAGMEQRFYADADARGWAGVAEVRYEDLVADPRLTLRRLYDALGLTWTDRFETRLTAYLARIADYRPGSHTALPVERRQALDAALGDLADRWRDADATASALRTDPVSRAPLRTSSRL